ncbi:MAG: hypothetical protein GY913_18555 [Proteobacteria bacterium]|nr:hypothetical protein [Pseudomonadota bacterium]MCP4918912.1 hypothetical protein [Pseudomonadota bacterium]
MSLTLLTAAALAHPVNGVFPSHQLELSVSAEDTELLLSIRMPTHDVVKELKGLEAEKGEALTREETDAFSAELLDEMRDNVRVSLDGAPVAWTRLDSSAEGTTKFITYDQRLTVAHDAGPHALTLSNGNLPEQTAYFMASVHLDPALVVETSSLLVFDEGELKRNLHERWRMDEAQREIAVAWRPIGALEGLQRDGDEPLPIADALAPEIKASQWLAGGLLAALLGLVGVYLRRQMMTSSST